MSTYFARQNDYDHRRRYYLGQIAYHALTRGRSVPTHHHQPSQCPPVSIGVLNTSLYSCIFSRKIKLPAGWYVSVHCSELFPRPCQSALLIMLYKFAPDCGKSLLRIATDSPTRQDNAIVTSGPCLPPSVWNVLKLAIG